MAKTRSYTLHTYIHKYRCTAYRLHVHVKKIIYYEKNKIFVIDIKYLFIICSNNNILGLLSGKHIILQNVNCLF